MKDQVLSIEQMKHLKKLGVDTSKGSIYWIRRSHGSDIRDESKGEWFLSLQKDFMVCGFASHEIIPTLTLEDMLKIMPCALFCDQNGDNINLQPINYRYRMSLYLVKELTGYEIKYECFITKTVLIYRVGKTAMEAVYNMLCWLAENKLLGKIKKN